ncbi:hypothetical protein KTE91_28895 [Burkholderia multivorans]|uniref:hypothetical protein n=1 Tax=Burkholderia multivorans TaxID=87883 RepID=UPI001C213394|nr:hypothetical protein [Burkholderia multivorans]MBU9439102.1 hypothetical protein [Burkholderia multivorans]
MVAAVIGLSLVCLLLSLAVWRLFQIVESDMRQFDDPARLPSVLGAMARRVKQGGEWSQLELMRHYLRLALADVDRMRHDVGDHKMRESKRAAQAL